MLILADAGCPTLTFDVSATSGLYSTLAGVLAGFAFTALILLLTPRLSSPIISSESTPPFTESFGDAIRILLTAFLALVLTSLNYAVLGGEQQSSYRAAVEETVAGVGFAISGLLLVYAIVVTLDAVASIGQPKSPAIAEVSSFVRGVLAAFIAPLLVLYIYIGTRDYIDLRYGHGKFTYLDVLGLSLVLAQISAGIIAFVQLRRNRSAKWDQEKRERRIKLVAQVALVAVFLSAGVFASLQAILGACERASALWPVMSILVTFTVAFGFVRHLVRARL
jgi:hypothetical protein